MSVDHKYKICIVSIYFGKLPTSYAAWAYSCSMNPEIDFLLVTDSIRECEYPNIKIEHMYFDQLVELARQKISKDIVLDNPYKLCDYKPVFGVILEEYLRGYDYWAHCDIDMVFGDLMKFFREYQLYNYDKFLPLGHLSLYRNTPEVNNRFLLPANISNPHCVTFYTSQHLAYDEKDGINELYRQYGFSAFNEILFADIDYRHSRMTLARSKIGNHFPLPLHQEELFLWENGRSFHVVYSNGKIEKKEVIYIHFQKRGLKDCVNNYRELDSFIICPDGIKELNCDISREVILKHNPYRGKLKELYEIRKFEYLTRIYRYTRKLRKMILK